MDPSNPRSAPTPALPIRLLAGSAAVRRWTFYRPFADRTLCHFLRGRLTLPALALPALLDEFDATPITLREIPRGGWSTPLADVVMLLKLAACTRPKRLMEIGSFRGYTALFLAQHTPDNARIVTVDRYPEHGEAYLHSPLVGKMERRVGETAPAIFANDLPGSYDLIFIDADHAYESVRRDTELALPLVAPGGYVVWHDYANWGFFDGKNGVPEYLGELAAGRGLPLAHVAGTDLAIHSPAWGVEASPARAAYLRALRSDGGSDVGADPWKSEGVRA